ncbi:hypothetical protein AXG93_4201s1550 [Marchantia polymorpha subsp. ruderalis]|uniref:Uncharacterized protein n=1 Tax=Marchantia polymorpha subsp. ruderalis TaxID=1480154 RepID=A0A176WCH6_MARPO|nr:hypothetical protein AXG93_4201s1550 [Marchantia polymorpha subsp. ruderalis]
MPAAAAAAARYGSSLAMFSTAFRTVSSEIGVSFKRRICDPRARIMSTSDCALELDSEEQEQEQEKVQLEPILTQPMARVLAWTVQRALNREKAFNRRDAGSVEDNGVTVAQGGTWSQFIEMGRHPPPQPIPVPCFLT